MVIPGSKFTRKKEEAIAALLTQRNVEEAARPAGVGTQTLLRWLKVPEFVKEYRAARRRRLAINLLLVSDVAKVVTGGPRTPHNPLRLLGIFENTVAPSQAR